MPIARTLMLLAVIAIQALAAAPAAAQLSLWESYNGSGVQAYRDGVYLLA